MVKNTREQRTQKKMMETPELVSKLNAAATTTTTNNKRKRTQQQKREDNGATDNATAATTATIITTTTKRVNKPINELPNIAHKDMIVARASTKTTPAMHKQVPQKQHNDYDHDFEDDDDVDEEEEEAEESETDLLDEEDEEEEDDDEDEATLLISSDEEEFLETQRISLPELIVKKLLHTTTPTTTITTTAGSGGSDLEEISCDSNTQNDEPNGVMKQLATKQQEQKAIAEQNESIGTRLQLKKEKCDEIPTNVAPNNDKSTVLELPKPLLLPKLEQFGEDIENITTTTTTTPITPTITIEVGNNKRGRRGRPSKSKLTEANVQVQATTTIDKPVAISAIPNEITKATILGNIGFNILEKSLVFQCTLCNELIFNEMNNYMQHLRTTHQILRYPENSAVMVIIPQRKGGGLIRGQHSPQKGANKTTITTITTTTTSNETNNEQISSMDLKLEAQDIDEEQHQQKQPKDDKENIRSQLHHKRALELEREPYCACGLVTLHESGTLDLICKYCEFTHVQEEFFKKHLLLEHQSAIMMTPTPTHMTEKNLITTNEGDDNQTTIRNSTKQPVENPCQLTINNVQLAATPSPITPPSEEEGHNKSRQNKKGMPNAAPCKEVGAASPNVVSQKITCNDVARLNGGKAATTTEKEKVLALVTSQWLVQDKEVPLKMDIPMMTQVEKRVEAEMVIDKSESNRRKRRRGRGDAVQEIKRPETRGRSRHNEKVNSPPKSKTIEAPVTPNELAAGSSLLNMAAKFATVNSTTTKTTEVNNGLVAATTTIATKKGKTINTANNTTPKQRKRRSTTSTTAAVATTTTTKRSKPLLSTESNNGGAVTDINDVEIVNVDVNADIDARVASLAATEATQVQEHKHEADQTVSTPHPITNLNDDTLTSSLAKPLKKRKRITRMQSYIAEAEQQQQQHEKQENIQSVEDTVEKLDKVKSTLETIVVQDEAKDVATITAAAAVETFSNEAENKDDLMEEPKETTTRRMPGRKGKQQRNHICEICQKIFKKSSRLIEHMRVHTGELPFKCDKCDKRFRIKTRLAEHMVRHLGTRSFKCNVCDIAMATSQDLAHHKRYHTGKRPHACPHCPKAFVRSSDLKIHLRIHTGEKPFSCSVCNQSFRANQNLYVHMKTHLGIKDVKCEFCSKSFLRKIDLRVHMRSHTGEKPFKCEICGRAYSSRFNLRTHIERVHVGKKDVATKGGDNNSNKRGPRKSNNLRAELERQKELIEDLRNQLANRIKIEEEIHKLIVIPATTPNLTATATSTTSSISSTSGGATIEILTTTKTNEKGNQKPNNQQQQQQHSNQLTNFELPLPMYGMPTAIQMPSTTTAIIPVISNAIDTTSSLTMPSPTTSTITISSTTSSPKSESQQTQKAAIECKNISADGGATNSPTLLKPQDISILAVFTTQPHAAAVATTTPLRLHLPTTAATEHGSMQKKERKITSYFNVVGQKS